MRRKSTRNASKATPDKAAKESETPPPKTRRSRRRKRSPSKSSDSDEEVLTVTKRSAPEETPDTTTKSHTPSDEEAAAAAPEAEETAPCEEEPVWKVKSAAAEDAPRGEIQKLKICLTRPSPDSPDKGRSSSRRSKSNSQTEDETTSSEDKSARKTRSSRGSPSVRNDGLSSQEGDEDVDEKKGKGKSKGKHKSKIEKSPHLSETELQTNNEISENVQVTPQSPSIDKPVDNENDQKVAVDDIQNVSESVAPGKDNGEESVSKFDSDNVQQTKVVPDDQTENETQKESDDDEPLSVIQKSVNETKTDIAIPDPITTSEETPQKPSESPEETVQPRDDERTAKPEQQPTEQDKQEPVEDVVMKSPERPQVRGAKKRAQPPAEEAEKQSPVEKVEAQPRVEEVKEQPRVEEVKEQPPVEEVAEKSQVEEPKTQPQVEEPKAQSRVEEPKTQPLVEEAREQPQVENVEDSTEVVPPPRTAVEETVDKKTDVETSGVNGSDPKIAKSDEAAAAPIPAEKREVRKHTPFLRLKRNADYAQLDSAEATEEEPGKASRIRPSKIKRKWECDPALASTLLKVDLDAIQSVWPTIDFPEEPDLQLEVERERRRSVTTAEPSAKKPERKVSVEYKSEHSERPVFDKQTSVGSATTEGEDNSNIIAFNRKISIVDDTASKLKPPPSPAKNPTSSILFITNLVRPFTVKQLKELLERTGRIQEDGFWTDRIKSKCYVQYDTQDEAEATRNALHGVQWPIGNGKKLMIDYATEEEMQNAKNPPAPPPPPAPVEEAKIPAKENVEPVEIKSRPEEKIAKEVEKKRPEVHVREWDIGKKDVRKERSRSRERGRKHKRSPSPPEDFISRKQRKAEEFVPQKLMDDLFLKTKATPSIYWQPLSPEEISMKQQQRLIRMEEHKRRMEETSRMKGREMGRGAFRRRYD